MRCMSADPAVLLSLIKSPAHNLRAPASGRRVAAGPPAVNPSDAQSQKSQEWSKHRMSESTLIVSTAKLTRPQLAAVPTPSGTATHRPVPHAEIVEAMVETLSFRHIGVVREEYAVSKDG